MFRFTWLFIASIICAASALAEGSLVILPSKIALTGSTARQQLLAQLQRDGHFVEQLTNDVSFVSSDPKVVKIEDGVVVPVTNGNAVITANWSNQTAKAEVTVSGMQKSSEVSFRNQVQPILAKTGCSSGACHGAAAGQNGFRLSLRGYDDESDHTALTRGAFGRRIIPSDPGRSLFLLKPAGAVPHKGGKRFEVDSPEYRLLAEWIALGSPGPKKEEPRIERIEMLPERVVLKPGDSQQLLVRAHFSDGHTEDATRWAKFTAANASVATVDDNGNVQVMASGEGAITAWYLSRIAIGTVSVPFTNSVSPEVFAKAPRKNFIDEQILTKLRSLNLPPAPRSTDEEFVRRAYLDTIGTLPNADEVRRFLKDESSNKRDALIDSLLKRPEYVDYWTYRWSDLLLVSSKRLRTPAMWSYYNWVRNNVAANTPWDKMVRQLVTAQGNTLENGAGNFFILHDDPRLMAETTTQAFLGMSVNCAKCHNHPMEKWTNDEYYQFANLFSRVRAKAGDADGDFVIYASTSGDLIQPRTGKPQPPRPLEGKTLPLESPEDRRGALADWLTSPDNPYFARSVVNRVWANFMGVGLVEPVDDLRITNPASNEQLLSALAKYLADQKFDLRALMRTIMQSEAYQRSSKPLPESAGDTRFYSRYYPRRLMAEVLLDAVSQVTAVPTEFQVDLRNENRGLGDKYPRGMRAIQLPDTKIASYFLKAFGRPDREKTCECERTSEPSVTQVLHIANGDTINKKLQDKKSRAATFFKDKTSAQEVVEDVYLSALSRFPTDAEKKAMVETLNSASEDEKRAVVEDVFWAVLSSKEFLFNH